ncbi:putative serine/threonine-protein kinase/receptor, partial [Pseudolycoriella hygida]
MVHGTAVHSSSSFSNYSSTSSPRVYVDNAMNRNLGRVGMAHGTAVHSSSSCSNYSSSSTPRVYVDNALNRRLDRVGMEHGTAVHSKSTQGSYTSSSMYVDNALNRRLDRVGLERGTAVYSKSENTITSTPKTYVDNAEFRFGPVAKPSAVYLKSTSGGSVKVKTYVDNALNRRLERVGKPLGSMPVSKAKCPPTLFDFNQNYCEYPDKENMNKIYETLPDNIIEEIDNLINLNLARRDGKAATKKIPNEIELKLEMIIPFNELELGDKIGSGGFGDVHSAFWKGQQVAVKKLRVQRVTQARKKKFEDEVRAISVLNHANIITFYGACVVTPNLALQFDEETKTQLICDSFSALQYIHSKNMVHRDIKSKNIMLFDDKSRCKLTDFGLALKDEAETNASTKDFGFAGTEKYCPKEVIDGERLTIEQLKQVDVYSLALTTVELLIEKEPFDHCKNIHQIRKAIRDGEIPKLEGSGISTEKKDLLKMALSRNATDRPSAARFLKSFKQIIATEN